MTTYAPDFWAELGQKLLSYYFNILSLLIQSFSIEIVWQITTVTVKSCEQLHLQSTSECHCSTGRNTNQNFQSCVTFVSTEKFSIQLQAAWHLKSNLSTVNYDSNRFVPSLKRFGHCIDYFSAGPNVYLSKLKEHKIDPCDKYSTYCGCSYMK